MRAVAPPPKGAEERPSHGGKDVNTFSAFYYMRFGMFLQVVFKKFSSIDESIVLKMHGAFFIQKKYRWPGG